MKRFRRRDARQQSRSFVPENQALTRNPSSSRVLQIVGYPMVSVFATRLNCFPMYAEKADDARADTPDLASAVEVMAP